MPAARTEWKRARRGHSRNMAKSLRWWRRAFHRAWRRVSQTERPRCLLDGWKVD
jgi:hypothetical protein